MIAPLSLSNLLTVLVAFGCYLTAAQQAQGGRVRPGQLAMPACLAAVAALVLLAGVFAATWQHDLQWLAGLLAGSLLGHLRGWRLGISIDPSRGLVVMPSTRDGRLAGLALVLLAATDFTSAWLRDPVIEPQYVAAMAAFFAGYLGCRALAVAARVERARRHPPQVTPSPTDGR